MRSDQIQVTLPPWVPELIAGREVFSTLEDRMRLAVALSRENVVRRTGGPFGAAIFERDSGRLVAAGVNSVTRLNNCTLHGEMVAFMMAQAALGSFSLGAPGMPAHELVTSCEPCAMCLGAIHWARIGRIYYGFRIEDATAIGFDDTEFFRQLALPSEQRMIPSQESCREEALALAHDYTLLPDRPKY